LVAGGIEAIPLKAEGKEIIEHVDNQQIIVTEKKSLSIKTN